MRQASLYFLVGLSPTQVKPNQQPATQSALCKVTNTMKPLEGSSQTATQVKVLSPVIFNVIEADSFHLLEGNKRSFIMVRSFFLYRGLSPWYDYEWKVQELGRPERFSGNRISAAQSGKERPKRRPSGSRTGS